METLKKDAATPSLPPPILRLDPSTWGYVAPFLDYGDLFRLYSTTRLESVLSQRLTAGVRDLKASWRSPHYMNLDQALEHISRFENLTSLDYAEHNGQVRCWKPAKLSLLGRLHLTTLLLSFRGCPSIILGSGYPESLPRGLINLMLEDKCAYGRNSLADDRISLVGLPSSLLSLKVSSALALKVSFDDFASLPPLMERLELDCALSALQTGDDPSRHPNAPIVLPLLPSALKSLHIWACYGRSLIVRASSLPPSLEYFSLELFDESPVLSMGDLFGQSVAPVVELAEFEAHLPNLKTLLIPGMKLTPLQALSLIPRSVTRFELDIAGNDDDEETYDELVESFMEVLAPKLSFHQAGFWPALDKVLFRLRPSSKNANSSSDSDSAANVETTLMEAPVHRSLHMESLHLLSICEGIESFPENISSLKINNGTRVPKIPLNTEVFSLSNSLDARNLNLSLYLTPSHKLKVLALSLLPTQMWGNWFEHLPDTIEKVSATFAQTWIPLLTFMSTTSRLPVLSSLINMTQEPGLSFMKMVPAQVTSLSATFSPNSEHPKTSLEAFKNSKLEHLGLVISKSDTKVMGSILLILQNLPNGLKRLELNGACALTGDLPVKFPPSLTWLHWYSVAGPNSETYKPNPKVKGKLQRLELPPTLIGLMLTTVPSLPIEYLPPNISVYNFTNVVEEAAFFESRTPPSPGLSLHF